MQNFKNYIAVTFRHKWINATLLALSLAACRSTQVDLLDNPICGENIATNRRDTIDWLADQITISAPVEHRKAAEAYIDSISRPESWYYSRTGKAVAPGYFKVNIKNSYSQVEIDATCVSRCVKSIKDAPINEVMPILNVLFTEKEITAFTSKQQGLSEELKIALLVDRLVVNSYGLRFHNDSVSYFFPSTTNN